MRNTEFTEDDMETPLRALEYYIDFAIHESIEELEELGDLADKLDRLIA